MIPIVSLKNMSLSDKKTMDSIPSLELMRRAGIVLYKSIRWKGNINIVVGEGNNGGDGFALACLLAEDGYSPVVYKLVDDISDDAYYFEQKAKRLGVIINDYIPDIYLLDDADVIVDCLFGTGLNREPEGIYRKCIDEINSYNGKKIISCDINSGVNGDNGPTPTYVKSDVTICIQAFKKGMLNIPSSDMKEVVVGDIGIKLIEEEDYFFTSKEKPYQETDLLNDGDYFYLQESERRYYLLNKEKNIRQISYK